MSTCDNEDPSSVVVPFEVEPVGCSVLDGTGVVSGMIVEVSIAGVEASAGEVWAANEDEAKSELRWGKGLAV